VPLFQLLLDEIFTYIKTYSSKLFRGTSTALSLASLFAYSLPGISSCPGIHFEVTLLNLLSFSSTCMHSQTRDDSVVDVASAAKPALLSEHFMA
jgi:hypothetical protein